MSQQYYSVEQVATLLELHVRTVRGYVRDGRLKATRIGKQYRIARADFEEFTGRPAPAEAAVVPAPAGRAVPHAEASTIVQIDAIGQAATVRLTNTVLAAIGGRPRDGGRLRVETVYDEERASLKIVVLGSLGDTAELLKLINALTPQLD